MAKGGISDRQLRAIHAKLKNHEHVGFDRMKIYLMNERDDKTGKFFTENEAKEIAGSIYQKQRHNKLRIAKEKKP